ncbi:M56 family metallopeptidase [Bradyrhizobium sp.]|uniref:M56 family metallopeptidase n=1 Tax=Bradyrhizobium sp. TaxID=376 RepID=UPI003C4E349F
MILAVLAESALRSLLLGAAVWIGLRLLDVRNPHLQMTSWVMVLAASLSMPLLMHWTTVTITWSPPAFDPAPVAAPEQVWSANGLWPAESLWPGASPSPAALPSPVPPEFGVAAEARDQHAQAINWWAVATVIYALIAGLLVLRLAVGLSLTWRMVRAATPIRDCRAGGADLRVSDAIDGPVTFGSTILVPPQWTDWDAAKRQAVLAHEGAHVAHGDFYLLLLASLNRAVFWFSPFAWWHLVRLAELAEIISDAKAIEALEDRLSYAEILLDLMQHRRQVPVSLDMARACTVYARVERILGATMPPAKLGWRKKLQTAAIIVPVVIVSAGSIASGTLPASTLVAAGSADATAEARKPRQVDFYAFGPTSIFAVFRDGEDRFGQLSWQGKLRLSAEPDGTYSYPAAAGQITFSAGDDRPAELSLHENGRDMRVARIAEISGPGITVDASLLDSYVGWYELSPGRVLTVTRDGDRLFVQETGRGKFEVVAHDGDAFAGNHDDVVIFLRDEQAKVTRVLFQESRSGAHLAPRIAVAAARTIEDEFARLMAEVPDRFRDQIPAPGTKDAILRGIAQLQGGAPNYEAMSAAFAAKVHHQAPQLQAMLKTLGTVESIFFRGVGPGGYDIYGVKFANGSAEFRILLAQDGKVDDVLFRPDGDDTAGAIVPCSNEKSLRSHDGTAPIKMLLYNATGRDIRIYRLDTEGHRTGQGTIGSTMLSGILTSVDNPWVVADASGQCREIVLPGQYTRYHTVEASFVSEPPVRRNAPLAGSEDMLRRYIEALGRGAPDYDRMTPEVAVQTRAQLPLDHAIISRLGALRAISFRGVTQLGSDIYVAHFANGTAEWRIGLAKDGTIGHIALGPQS